MARVENNYNISSNNKYPKASKDFLDGSGPAGLDGLDEHLAGRC